MKLRIENLREEQRQIAEVIGMESYMKLSQKFGGTSIYIAKAEEIQKRLFRDERIREEFNGTNYAQLALKYGLTDAWVRNIVYDKAEEIRKRPIDGQINILDFLEKD